jgi:hypothetical protein
LRLPARAARQLPDQSTTLWVDSSSTGDSRLRGALPLSDSCTAAIVSNRLYHAACEPGAKSILAGLQLGLDAALAVLSLDLMGSAPAMRS